MWGLNEIIHVKYLNTMPVTEYVFVVIVLRIVSYLIT